MMEDLFGNPVKEVVHDDAAEIKRNLADALNFWMRMEQNNDPDSLIVKMAKEGYFKMKREAGL